MERVDSRLEVGCFALRTADPSFETTKTAWNGENGQKFAWNG
jgi:hypothetical protein